MNGACQWSIPGHVDALNTCNVPTLLPCPSELLPANHVHNSACVSNFHRSLVNPDDTPNDACPPKHQKVEPSALICIAKYSRAGGQLLDAATPRVPYEYVAVFCTPDPPIHL